MLVGLPAGLLWVDNSATRGIQGVVTETYWLKQRCQPLNLTYASSNDHECPSGLFITASGQLPTCKCFYIAELLLPKMIGMFRGQAVAVQSPSFKSMRMQRLVLLSWTGLQPRLGQMLRYPTDRGRFSNGVHIRADQPKTDGRQ